MNLTPDEKKMILDMREKRAQKEREQKAREENSLPASRLTREQLIKRCERMELEEFIARAERRRIKTNDSGDWEWDSQDDVNRLRYAYHALGKEMPRPAWITDSY